MLVGSEWELDYSSQKSEPANYISNLTLNGNKTFVWHVVDHDYVVNDCEGTYSIDPAFPD